MDGSGSGIIQLATAGLAALLLFVAAYSLKERVALAILLVILPFQLITSRYGSMNVMLVYLISAAFLLRGRFSYIPLKGPFIAIFVTYLISMSLAHRSTWFDHSTYIIGFGANVLAFLLLYNFVRREENWNAIWKTLIWLNCLVLLYCAIQLTFGFERFAPFGISEFSILQNRADQRLVGPFTATAITAEYLVMQVLLLAYAFIRSRIPPAKLFYISLIGANCFFLVTTGNRGGLVSLIIGMLGFLFIFRREIGLAKSLGVVTMIATVFVVMAGIAVQYTQFNRLFQRLEETRVEGFIPDSRQGVWPVAIERIMEKPILGHGPRLRLIDETRRRIPGHRMIGYPHSAYLHLLYTIGIVGLLAYTYLFLSIARRLYRSRNNSAEPPVINGLPRLGLLILFVILVSQIRIEMFRFDLFDYQNIIFAVFGVFVGFADVVYADSRSTASSKRRTIVTRRLPIPDAKPVVRSTHS